MAWRYCTCGDKTKDPLQKTYKKKSKILYRTTKNARFFLLVQNVYFTSVVLIETGVLLFHTFMKYFQSIYKIMLFMFENIFLNSFELF